MFLCGNSCTADTEEPEIAISNFNNAAKLMTAISRPSKRTKKDASVMLKKSKYDQYVEECKIKNTKFVDKEFPPDEKSLNFKVEGRQIVWKRITEVIKDCVIEDEKGISSSDIHQGNIGDCYFLSSLAAIAEVSERIQHIFHDNFEISPYGIYKLVIVQGGIPCELLIDDFIPVFATTNRPVFCKAVGKQIWVILLEKAWAKIKGSYGDISAGCPHEVLQTFSVAPCFYYQLEDDRDPRYYEYVWGELTEAADEMMPIVAGTKSNVNLQGLLPAHAYSILDCQDVPSYGQICKLIKMRNPWGKTEYTGYGSESDTKFWEGVPENFREQMRPPVGVDDGVFTIPFNEFMKSFQSIDILNVIFGFSYQFQTLKMRRGQPLFIRLDIEEQHQAYITIERNFKQEKNTNLEADTTNYGYSRLVIAHQLDQETFEYYTSQLETDFPDITCYVQFKPGRYLMYIEIDDTRLTEEFQSTFSYYYDTPEIKEKKNKNWEVQYKNKYPKFLESVFTNHAIRMNSNTVSLNLKSGEDWIKSCLLYDQGGFGYVMCNLGPGTPVKVAVTIDKTKLKESGFYLMGSAPQAQVLEAGNNGASKIFIFSCKIDSSKNENIVFPPTGFKISKVV